MFSERQYIAANKNACVNNCIRSYLWQNQSFSDTLAEITAYLREKHYCNPAEMVKAVKDVLQTMTTEIGVKSFIRKCKKTYVSPSYTTVNAFIQGEYETPGLTARKIAEFVISEMEGLQC